MNFVERALEVVDGNAHPVVDGVEIDDVIGSGGFSHVYRGHRPDGHVVAVKVAIVDDREGANRIAAETKLLRRVAGHPNVIEVHETGLTHDRRAYLVMEYAARGSMEDVLQNSSPDWVTVTDSSIRVARALAHVHDRGVVHRDVKPANMLVTETGDVRLADFGTAVAATDPDEVDPQGVTLTVHHVPPEVLDGEEQTSAGDVYSLASSIFTMLHGRPPFSRDGDDSIVQMLTRIASGQIPATDPVRVPDAVGVRLRDAMASNPADRPTAAEFAGGLQTALDAHRNDVLATAVGSWDVRGALQPTPAPVLPASVSPPAPPPPTVAPPYPVGPHVADVGTPAPRAPNTGEVFVAASHSIGTDTSERADIARLPLVPTFRFVHGPLGTSERGVPFVGNAALVTRVANRLRYSTGGAVLLTGFRGAGKTTVATRALETLAAQPHDETIVPIVVSVARATSLSELLTVVIRQLFEQLNDLGLMPSIHPDARRAVVLAYLRTSLSLKQTSGSSTEQSGSLGFERWGAKLGLSATVVETLASEAQFVAYNESDLEYDLVRIAQLLVRPHTAEPHGLLQRLGLRPAEQSTPVRTIVVVDELDKLTATEEGTASLDALLGALKGVMTSVGLTFMFVGGADLHDRYVEDVRRGNSIYESIFSWHQYVPCLWDGANDLLGALVESDGDDQLDRGMLTACARFESRGLPRRLLQHVNRLVHFDDAGSPFLGVGTVDAQRMKMLADLDEVVWSGAVEAGRSGSIDHDRQILATYYATDWILRTAGAEFTVADIVSAPDDDTDGRPIDPLLGLQPIDVERLLERLARARVIATPERNLPGVPQRYWLHRTHAELVVAAGMAQVNRARREQATPVQSPNRLSSPVRSSPAVDGPSPVAPVGHAPALDQPVDDRTVTVPDDLIAAARVRSESATSTYSRPGLIENRYEVGDVILHGSFGTMYHATDRQKGVQVAVKMVSSPTLLADAEARARLEREMSIAADLDHPNLARVIDTLDLGEHGPVQIFEALDGVPLVDVAESGMDAERAVRIGIDLAGVVAHLGGLGIGRLGLAASDILLGNGDVPVVVNLGLARRLGYTPDAITRPGFAIGEVVALAPEQAFGPGDHRSDIYGLGVLLGGLIGGQDGTRRVGEAADAWLQRIGRAASPSLQWVLRSMLQEDPDRRPASMQEVIASLLETDEGRASSRHDPHRGAESPADAAGPSTSRRIMTAAREDGEPVVGGSASPNVSVLGAWCPRQHLNPVEAQYCGQCGRSMFGVTVELGEGVRPTLGTLSVTTQAGDVELIPLDHDLIIGRSADSHPDVVEGSAVAVVLSHSHDVSRSHCSIRLEGWDVVVHDLASANGTYVLQPNGGTWSLVGSAGDRLQDGALVRLGDQTLRFDSAFVIAS